MHPRDHSVEHGREWNLERHRCGPKGPRANEESSAHWILCTMLTLTWPKIGPRSAFNGVLMGAMVWCHSSGVRLTAEKKHKEGTMGRWGLVRG